MAYLKIFGVFSIMFACYFIPYIFLYKKYTAINKDTTSMTTEDFSLSSHRNLKFYILTIAIVCFCYAVIKIDPSNIFMDAINYIFTALYILIYILTIHSLKWHVIIKDDTITVSKPFVKDFTFKFSDIKKVEKPSIDALLTLKSEKNVTIFGKCTGFNIFIDRLKKEKLL
jgi:hypothetical protein